ncbi:MAG: RNA degradosome polyphosphate kinase, partial [Gemmatimonadales bacterium]
MTDVRPRNVPQESRPVTPPDFRHPSLFINRELSWLEFNRRVLHEAQDSRTPLLERLKFLAIFSSNLDEFFQVRVAGLKQQVTVGYAERTADGMTPESQLKAVNLKVRDLVEQHGLCLTQEVLPSLGRNGVAVLNLDDVSLEDREYIRRYFHANVFPVLTPLAVDPAHPIPYITNLSISIAVILRDEDGEERFARVKVPQILDRWVPLPEPHTFVPLEQVIGSNLESLFPGVEVLGWHTFRITRNTEYQIDHDEAEDLLDSIQEEVRNRRFGEVTRLEVHPSMPMWLREILLSEFAEESESLVPWLTEEDIYEVHGSMHAAQLMS